MKTNQVIHIFALKSRGNKTSDINFNDILSKILTEFHVSQMINEIYLKGKCPIKANYKTTCAMLWLLFQLWYLFCVEKKGFLGELRLNCALFFGFFEGKKKKNWAGRPQEMQETSCANYNLLVYKTSHDTMSTLEYTERTWHFKVLKSRGKTNWK